MKHAHYEYMGITSEGMPFSLIASFDTDAPNGAKPLAIVGHYASSDGGGFITVTDEAELPAVVADGIWTRVA